MTFCFGAPESIFKPRLNRLSNTAGRRSMSGSIFSGSSLNSLLLEPFLVLRNSDRFLALGARNTISQQKLVCYNGGLLLPSAWMACVGEWLSLVEHLVRDQGVGGSNPLSPTNLFNDFHAISGPPPSTLRAKLGLRKPQRSKSLPRNSVIPVLASARVE
jgi:hypothetical protein